MKKIATNIAFAFMALGLVGCDEVKSLVASISIEQPVVSIESEYYERPIGLFDKVGDIRKIVKIQSKDDKTIINGMKANRGNCATAQYAIDNKKLKTYADANPDKVLLNGGAQLQTTSGDLVTPKKTIYSDDLSFYESLNEQSKAVYNNYFPVKLPFGKTDTYYQGFFKCKIDTIIEIELIVNDGASISYSFDQTM